MVESYYKTVIEFITDVSPAAEQIVICGLFRSRGGASRVVEQQAIDLTEAGYDVTVVALEADMEAPEGVTLRILNPVQEYKFLSKAYWLFFPLLPWMIAALVQLRKHDMVIAHRYPFTVSGYILSRFTDTTYTYWSHPSGDSAAGFSGLAGVWSRIIHRFETRGRSIAKADYICAVSEKSKQYIESKIDRSVIVVPNKINTSRFTSVTDPDRLRRKYDFEKSDQIVLFVGRITERKNVHSLIEMFGRINKETDQVKLVIAGSESQSGYADRIKEQVGPNVVFTGYVSDEDLAGLYARADIFATCSLEEGWGLPISEAQHFDTPVIAFDSHPAALKADDRILVEEKDYEAFERELRQFLQKD